MQNNQTISRKSYALPIAMMFALLFLIAFVTNLAGSMGVILKNQFETSNAVSQLGTFANFLAYAFMGVPAGIILKRKGYKFTSLLAIAVGIAGVGIQCLSGVAGSFAVYVAGAFVAGFSMCMLNVVAMPMLNTLGGGGNKGNSFIQFGNTFNSVGGTITPILVGYLVGDFATAQIADAYPAMYIAMGVFALAFVVIALNKIPEPHLQSAKEREDEKKQPKDKYSPLSFRHFVLGAIAIFFYVGIENGIPNTANLYISEVVNPAVAGSVIGVYWFLMMCGRFIGAAVGSFISSKNMLAGVATLGIILVLCALLVPDTAQINLFRAELPLSMLFIPLCGLATSVMFGGIFNLSTEGLGKYTPVASGIYMALVCGGGVIPVLQNYLADHFGAVQSYWIVVLCLLYILWYALSGCKNVNKNIPVD
ncbi:MAG: MFS transporter [Bacteroidetes bacterium]|uniref:MFS transporter n=1 Tax=Candidatus Enterocola intestinipullorum TaxID=2840783 RepID=A0A9D9EEQ3_9BACT|nr:MFS transporter [Candidatus Enterocola intestinipullorum]